MNSSHCAWTPEILPSGESEIFRDSSFFTSNPDVSLPTPAEVREKHGDGNPLRPRPVDYPDLALTVKFGFHITIAEGQCLWAIHRFLPSVPVPEVFGWCHDGGDCFIYMQLVQGETLENRWDGLSTHEKEAVCQQLKSHIGRWRQLQQPPGEAFIGHIGKQPLQDIIFSKSLNHPTKTFPNVSAFQDWFTSLGIPQRRGVLHSYRHWLPDDFGIMFTHGDLHRSNIIVSTEEDGPIEIRAIIDWHQSGWLPSYWEYCKTRWTTRIGKEEWEVTYLPMMLEPSDIYDQWDFFVLRLGV